MNNCPYTNLYMIKGDTFLFSMEIIGLEHNLTAAYLSCKKNKDDDTFSFQKSLGDGIALVETTESGKTYSFTVDPEDTEDLEPGNYYYDVQITTAAGEIFTPLLGMLRIDYDITTN